MLDLAFIRTHAKEVEENARRKNVTVDVQEIVRSDGENRSLITKIETLRAEQKAASKSKPTEATQRKLRAAADSIQKLRERQRTVEHKLEVLLLGVPNIASPDTPVGKDEKGNRILRTVGEQPIFHFKPKPHWELGIALGVLDIERAAEVSGPRFVYLKGQLVLMQFALIQFVLAVVTNRARLSEISAAAGLQVPSTPFTPVLPPVFIRPDVFGEMARLEPRDERYYIPSDDLYLTGSAEHTLGPLHRGETLDEEKLPLRYIGYSTAFRREAGSYGKDVRGMIRVHQFDKLELESFTSPEQSLDEQNFFVAIQEYLLQALALPYRVVQICTGDMGAPDARQIDVETWMPGLAAYKETHTADLMGDYQARRLQTRVRRREGGTVFAHMNDATAFAIGRTLVAIMENYQQEDGTIRIPDALRPYLPGSPAVLGK